ncbi:MAG: reprolysin-like metallopeptidase [Fidelibacterota bacterium]
MRKAYPEIKREAKKERAEYFAHEIGHNFGCNHDRAKDGDVHGFTHGFKTLVDGWTFGIIMAYAERRVPVFSNPSFIIMEQLWVMIKIWMIREIPIQQTAY